MAALGVLHVAPYGGDAWAYGGIPRLAQSLTIALAHRGHDVTFATTDVCDETSRLGEARASLFRSTRPPHRIVDGVTHEIFPNLSNRAAYHAQFFTPRGLVSYMRREAASFDVAHLHACRNLPGLIAGHFLEQAGVPYVLAPNGTAPIIERRRWAKRAFDVLAGGRVSRHARRVIAVSQAERRQLLRLGIAEERIRLIPNPVDLDEFASPPARGSFRQRICLADEPLVLYLGKLTPRKRVEDLVAAFGRIVADAAGTGQGGAPANAKLVIAGNDMGSGPRIRRAVAVAGVAGHTRVVGLLRGRERLEALADADVVVYPAEHEIFGLVPMEAVLSGTPVVVSDDSGCGEVVARVGGGLVVPVGDVSAIAAAVTDVLAHRDEWRGRARRAAQTVQRLFGSDTVGQMVSDLYEELAASA